MRPVHLDITPEPDDQLEVVRRGDTVTVFLDNQHPGYCPTIRFASPDDLDTWLTKLAQARLAAGLTPKVSA